MENMDNPTKNKLQKAAVEALQEEKDLQDNKAGAGYQAHKLDVEKYLLVKKAEDDFLNKSPVEEKPKFVVLGGPIGVGKTTIRREKYSEGYVMIDSEDAFQAVKKFENDPEQTHLYLQVLGMELVARAIAERRNIIIEVLLDTVDPIQAIIEKMKGVGYDVQVVAIQNDVETSWQNNLKRGKDNVSALYTQELTMSWFVSHFGIKH